MRIFLTKLNSGWTERSTQRNGGKMNLIVKFKKQFKEIFGDKKIDIVCEKANENNGLIEISNPQSLSEETKKKIEEKMFKDFIKDARKGGL